MLEFYQSIQKSLSVSDDSIPVDTTLLVFIREYAKFRGTKAMCHAGDCGACVVSVIFKDKTIAVNSCLVLVLTCDRYVCMYVCVCIKEKLTFKLKF